VCVASESEESFERASPSSWVLTAHPLVSAKAASFFNFHSAQTKLVVDYNKSPCKREISFARCRCRRHGEIVVRSASTDYQREWGRRKAGREDEWKLVWLIMSALLQAHSYAHSSRRRRAIRHVLLNTLPFHRTCSDEHQFIWSMCWLIQQKITESRLLADSKQQEPTPHYTSLSDTRRQFFIQFTQWRGNSCALYYDKYALTENYVYSSLISAPKLARPQAACED
jgi:hypothetical protein